MKLCKMPAAAMLVAATVVLAPRLVLAEGACCVDRFCYDEYLEAECIAEGGTFRGEDTDCATDGCPGACCAADGSCVEALTYDACVDGLGGEYRGLDTTCGDAGCSGACGLPGDACVDDQTRNDCTGMGGLYWGSGTVCAEINEKLFFLPNDYIQPHMAMAGDGSFAIAYPQDDGDGIHLNIYVRYFDANGVEVAGPIQANTAREFNDNYAADVAMNAAGHMAVAWRNAPAKGDESTVLQVLAADGSKIDVEKIEPYPDGALRRIEVAMDDTRIVVGWGSSFPGRFEFARFDLDVEAGTVTKRGSTITVHDASLEFGDAIAIGIHGDTIAAAYLPGAGGVQYQTYSFDTGSLVTGPVEIDDSGVQRSGIELDLDDDGRVLVAWIPFSGNGSEVFAQYLSAAGEPDGAAFPITESSDGFNDDVRVLSLGSGQWKVVWYNNGQNLGLNGVFCRTLNAPADGAIERLDTIGDFAQYPAAATNGSGRTAVAWYAYFEAISGSSGVYGVLDAGTCRGDFDGDGMVGFREVLDILATWGNQGGTEDVDGDGEVGFGDVLFVLANWGPCPARVYTVDGQGLDLTPFDDLYDGSLGSMASITLNVPDDLAITDVNVTLDVSHTWAGDLVVKLESPAGTLIDLVSRAGLIETADDGTGCCGESSDLVFGNSYVLDDAALDSSENMGSGGEDPIDSFALFSSGFANTMGLTLLNGESSAGTWTLYVGDAAAADNGTLDGFTLEISGVP